MAIKPYKRPDSPKWWIRGKIKGFSVRESTGIDHGGRAKAPLLVWDLCEQRTLEIHQQRIHGKSTNARFLDAAQNYLESGGSPRFLGKQQPDGTWDGLLGVMGDILIKDIDQELLNKKSLELYGHCTPETRNRQFFTPFIAVWKHNTKGQHPLCSYVEWKRPNRSKKKRAVATDKSKTTTYEEAIQFINHLHPAAAKVMFFLFWTGCRPGEAFGLDHTHVNLDDRWIIFDESKTDIPRGIPIYEGLVPLLEHCLKHDGAVFLNSHGRPWPDFRKYNAEGRLLYQRGGQMRQPLATAKDKTGLAITPYMARHTVSTYLIWPGGVEKVIKDEILGHSQSNDVSLDYIHLPRQTHLDAINKLPDPLELGLNLQRLLT